MGKASADSEASTTGSFWICLESNYGLSNVSAIWQRDLGPHFAAFSAAFLERRSETALSFPCPFACGCAHEIIRHGPNDIVAVCRCERWNCDDLKLSTEDIRLWSLSWSRLGRALCRCLGFENKPAELGWSHTRQIGSWSAAAVPVILTIQPEPRRFRQTLLELALRLQTPFILLAPTSQHITAPCLELLARAKAGFFDLASHIRLMPNGALLALKTPGELFAAFTPEPDREDRTVLQRAFALAKTLDAEVPLRQPSPVAVFSEYCLQGLNVSQIARKFRCSRGTVLNRLTLIRQRTGMEPDSLRQISPHLEKIENELSDSRASRIYRKALLDPED